MEEEWEEEEQLVVVELSGIIDSDFLTKCQGKVKIVGIDTEQPIMQVGRYVFAGEYEDVLGTCVIFEENHGSDARPQLRYRCHTVKKLMMQRTFLTEKKEGEPSSGRIEFLPLNDGAFPGRNNMICNFLQDPSGTAGQSCVMSEKGDAEIPHKSESEAEAEASDCEQAELSQDSARVDFPQSSSASQGAEDSLDTTDSSAVPGP
ncbi:general transcription factor 3C polypeptide 6 [Megalops cyprinoides]|uniref:general transcription factor 3C polypeptide 6 n=1 Tax=Megalops cyprinoides TaxID=118141 RepID=UPI0018653F8C|nr:general transcription factor 3C polypeptide 6 [Megalops cyprinoides]